MSLVIGLLTFILVLNCLFLMLLVLIQLPKKEAGAGVAFGGGATDALFGAGSGTALTRITKYTAGAFLGIALVLAVLNSHRHARETTGIQQELNRELQEPPAAVQQPAPAPGQPQPLVTAPPETEEPALAPGGTSAPVLTPSTSAPVINLTPQAAPAETAPAEIPAEAPVETPADTPAPAENPAPVQPAAEGPASAEQP